jgi:hypothetical protein
LPTRAHERSIPDFGVRRRDAMASAVGYRFLTP